MLCNAWVLGSDMRASERGVWFVFSSFKQRARIFFCSITVNFRRREDVCKMEKSFRMLEQVLQDVHVLLQCGERMLLGQVVRLCRQSLTSSFETSPSLLHQVVPITAPPKKEDSNQTSTASTSRSISPRYLLKLLQCALHEIYLH